MKESKTFIGLAKGLGKRFIDGSQRYPVSIFMAAAAAVIGVILNHSENIEKDTERLLISLIMALAVGLLFSLVFKTIIENFRISFKFRTFLWIVLGSATVLYAVYLYSFMENMEMFEMMRFAALILIGFVLFMTAVFRRKTDYQEVFSTEAGWRLAITAIYTLIIWGGISLILFAIEKLLNVNIDEKAYLDTIILAMGFFAPVFFFGGVPKTEESLEPERVYKFFKILVLYVIAPLLTAYTVVFYIYALRILFTWDWPDGLVGNMVLWYALIGTITMYFLHGMDKDSKWASIFGKWFPRIIILPIVLLFISLGIRINAYGLTASRYMLGAAGVWVLGSAVYMSIFNYKKRCTRIITVSLVVIVLISFVGPLNAINTGRISQTNRLEKLLVENNLLKDGALMQNTSLSEKTKGEISDKINYLERNYNFKNVNYLPEDFTVQDMKQVFGFEYTYYYDDPYNQPGENDYVFINNKTVGSIADISGYDYLWDSDNYTAEPRETNKGMLLFTFERNEKDSMLNITLDENTVFSKDMTEYMGTIKEIWDVKGENITLDDMTFTEVTNYADIKIVFTNAEFYPEETDYRSGWIRFYVMVKMK